MAEAITYCDRCARLILPSEIERGGAFPAATGMLCASCAESLSPAERAALARTPPPARHPVRPATHRTASAASGARLHGHEAAPAARAREGPARRTPMLFIAGLGGGGLVGLAAALVFAGGGKAPPDPTAPATVPPVERAAGPRAPFATQADAVAHAIDRDTVEEVRSPPPAPARLDRSAGSRSSAEQAEGLDAIREMIGPSLDRYDEIREALVALRARTGEGPEAEEARLLLAEVDTRHAALADRELATAAEAAEALAAAGRHAEAASLVRSIRPRFGRSEWYRARGEKEVAAVLAKIEAAEAARHVAALDRARKALAEGNLGEARAELAGSSQWPDAKRLIADQLLAGIARTPVARAGGAGGIKDEGAGAELFVDGFGRAPGGRWVVHTDPGTKGLRWAAPGEEPGLHFYAKADAQFMTRNVDYAFAEWPIGTQPFELACDVAVDKGTNQVWFNPGVCVAVSSARPGEMTADDVSIVWAVQQAGVAASVRRGETYSLCDGPQPPRDSQIGDRELSNLIPHAGGHIHSQAWPGKSADGARLALRMRRETGGVVTFTAHDLARPRGADDPWWQGSWKLPEDVARVPLGYITVKRVPVLSVHLGNVWHVISGRVAGIRAWTLSASPPPETAISLDTDAKLAGFWTFDEPGAADSSPARGRGTLAGGPAWRASWGRIGGALRLDGADDAVDCGAVAGLGAAFTLALWIKPESAKAQAVAAMGKAGAGGWALEMADDRSLRFRIGGTEVVAEGGVEPGRWIHVAAAFEGGAARLHLDGAEAARAEGIERGADDPNARLSLGAASLAGWIDDVRVYARALGADEVGALVGKAGLVERWLKLLAAGADAGTIDGDGYALDRGMLGALAAGHDPTAVAARRLAAMGGAVAASSSFDHSLKRALTAKDGYTFAARSGLAARGLSLAAARKGLERNLERTKPEVVRICFDATDVAAGRPLPDVRSDLEAVVRAAAGSGAVPVLFTLPMLSPRDEEAKQLVAGYNATVLAAARDLKVPCVDAYGILNEDQASLGSYFTGGGALKPAGFEAVNERFLRLYRVLEIAVMGRDVPLPAGSERGP